MTGEGALSGEGVPPPSPAPPNRTATKNTRKKGTHLVRRASLPPERPTAARASPARCASETFCATPRGRCGKGAAGRTRGRSDAHETETRAGRKRSQYQRGGVPAPERIERRTFAKRSRNSRGTMGAASLAKSTPALAMTADRALAAATCRAPRRQREICGSDSYTVDRGRAESGLAGTLDNGRRLSCPSHHLDAFVPVRQRFHQRPDHPRLAQRGRRAPAPASPIPEDARILPSPTTPAARSRAHRLRWQCQATRRFGVPREGSDKPQEGLERTRRRVPAAAGPADASAGGTAGAARRGLHCDRGAEEAGDRGRHGIPAEWVVPAERAEAGGSDGGGAVGSVGSNGGK